LGNWTTTGVTTPESIGPVRPTRAIVEVVPGCAFTFRVTGPLPDFTLRSWNAVLSRAILLGFAVSVPRRRTSG
jgi:hypothetical protein